MLPVAVAVARSSSDRSAICYSLLVLWTTSSFHIIDGLGKNKRRCLCFVQFHRWSPTTNNVLWSSSPGWLHRTQNLPSTTASCISTAGIISMLIKYKYNIWMEMYAGSVATVACCPVVSHVQYTPTDRETDGRTPDRYVTLSAVAASVIMQSVTLC